jgi:hypothetical protein
MISSYGLHGASQLEKLTQASWLFLWLELTFVTSRMKNNLTKDK